MIFLTAGKEVRLAFGLWLSQVYDGSCGKRHSTENLGSKVGEARGWQWMAVGGSGWGSFITSPTRKEGTGGWVDG